MTIAALGVGGTIAAAGALAGTGVSIAGQAGAFGGGGGGGGGGGAQNLTPLNPAWQGLASGIFNPYVGPYSFPPNGFVSDLTNMLTAPGLNKYQTNLPQGLLGQALGVEQGTQAGPLGGILPTIEQAATNPQQFLQPTVAAAERQFSQYGLPQIAEQFAGTTGVNSSDFGAQAARSAGDIATNLGALAPQLQMQALPLAMQGIQANVAMPVNLASDIASYGSQLRGQQISAQPGYQGLQQYLSLAGLANNLPYAQQGYSPFGSGLTQGIGALGAGIPALGQGLSGLFGPSPSPYQMTTQPNFSLTPQTLTSSGGVSAFGGGNPNVAGTGLFGP